MKNLFKKRSNERTENPFKAFLEKTHTIRTELTAAFFIPVILIVILGIISYHQAESSLTESYENTTLSTVTSMARYLDFGLTSAQNKANVLGSNDLMIKYYSGSYKDDPTMEEERLAELKSLITSDILSLDYVSNILVFSNYGEGISGSGISEDKLNFDNYAANGEAKLIEEAGNEDGFWLGEHPYLDELIDSDASKYSLSYIKPVYNIIKRPIGCIVLNVSRKFIDDSIKSSGLPEGSIFAFITRDGREMASEEVSESYQFSDQVYYKEALEDDASAGSRYTKISGKDYLISYSKLDESGSVLICAIPKSAIMEGADRLKAISVAVVLVAAVIAIFLGALIAYGFSNAMKGINLVLHKAGTGDLTCQTDVKRKDEFRMLGDSINNLLHNMQELIVKMTNTSNTVSDSAVIVSDSSDVLVSASKNISDAVNDINNGVTQQAADAESCLLQMGDLAERINNLYIGTRNIEQIAGNTEQIVNKGMTIIDDFNQKAQDTKKATDTVISDIERLAKESRSIYSIIETINGIANQTNLLSLNASIEAARAGEYGRGFSVVAEEVRKLAEQSLKSSGEITKIIKNIEEQTKKTTETAKHTESIVSSQEEALNSTVSVFRDINKHVENLSLNLNQIVAGTEGIESAKNDTLRSIESISATTQEAAAATEELNAITANQMEEVFKLGNVIQQLNNNAVNLAEAVHVFKVNDI